MKKVLLFIILLCPLVVRASELNVISHLIDSEIEIAGGLNVKELIIVEGDADYLQRNINYYSFGNKAWDGETINLNNGTIYNGQNISIVNVSAYEIDDKVEFGSFNKNVKEYFKPFDIKNPSDNTYTFEDNKNGQATLKIFYPTNNKRTAYYINYVVTNVVVKHNDIKEINYTFKNLKYKAEETYLRVILPYPTNSDLYNVWVHGNKSGSVQELVDKNDKKLGIIAKFPTVKEEINFRITLEPEQVGVDMFINASNIDALDQVKKIEEEKLINTNKSKNIINVMKYVLTILGIIYVIGSFIFIKFNNNIIYYIYIAFGLFIMLFNFLFRFNYWYLYLVLLFPLGIKIIKKYIVK